MNRSLRDRYVPGAPVARAGPARSPGRAHPGRVASGPHRRVRRALSRLARIAGSGIAGAPARILARSVAAGPAAAVAAAVALVVGAAVGGAAGDESIEARLAAASPERGEEVFLVCRACHMIDEGAPHTIGPNLWGVVGRPVASAAGYDRYTPAMSALGGTWSPERLDVYLRQPMMEVQGTTMAFPGVPDAGARADLIAWLNRNSAAPLDLGAGGGAGRGAGGAPASGTAPGDPGAAAAPSPARDLGLLVAGEGAAETHALCTPCHSERIVAQQGLTRAGWEELLEQMVDEHEMIPIEEPALARVLGYLATHYGTDRPNFP